jgi:hypothetical protein
MGEVIFLRSLMFALAILLIVILFKVIYPWIRALCIKLDLEGKEVVEKVSKESKEGSEKPEVPVKGGKSDVAGWKDSVGSVDSSDGDVHEVSVIAAEARKVSGRRRKM